MKEKNEVIKIADMFKMLSNPIRLCILMNLSHGESKNVTQLIHCSNVTQSSVSQQLAKLKLAGIIKSNKVGSEVYYELKDQKILDIINYVMKG